MAAITQAKVLEALRAEGGTATGWALTFRLYGVGEHRTDFHRYCEVMRRVRELRQDGRLEVVGQADPKGGRPPLLFREVV